MRTQRNSWAVQFQESFLLSDSNYMDLSSLTIGGYKEVQYLWTKSGLFPIYTIKGDINCHIQFWEVTRLVESFKNINRKKCIHVACVCVYVCVCVCACAQWCLTLCNPMSCSPPGSSVHGIFQARILDWICHFLLQGIFPTQGLNSRLLHFQVDSLPLVPSGKPSCS